MIIIGETMKTSMLIVTALLIASQINLALSLESTVPAFMWSSHIDEKPSEAVNYQTISPKGLARSVLAEGGWSNILCGRRGSSQPPLDIAFVFLGKELQMLDTDTDSALSDSVKAHFTKANFSRAFPYVSLGKEEQTMESSLVTEFSDACGQDLGLDNIVLIGSCLVEGKGYKQLADIDALHDYLSTRREEGAKGTDLVMYCHEDTESSQGTSDEDKESNVFSNVINSLEQSGTRYAILYASDPYKSIEYPSSRQVERFLAEASGNVSAQFVFCDEVCQFKKSLLEGIIVGITLLIILVSGLCCMMGIDSPTRFEKPQE